MAKKSAPTVQIVCPCCQAKLTIDPQLQAVLSHEEPPRAKSDIDLTDAERILRDQAERREEHFRQSWEAEKNKEEILARKFEENLKKAKDQPVTKPLRDFDLD